MTVSMLQNKASALHSKISKEQFLIDASFSSGSTAEFQNGFWFLVSHFLQVLSLVFQ